ncbi:sortase [bacterium]|nr:sortase [bacterium]
MIKRFLRFGRNDNRAEEPKKSNYYLTLVIYGLQISTVVLVLYLILLPVYPSLKYKVRLGFPASREAARDVTLVKEQTAEFKSSFPASEYAVSPNRVMIPKIGVNAPIVVTNNAEYGLSKGAWLVPDTSTPDKGGNTVITGHRFKYLPPNNLTFYLFHKLEVGDLVSVIWDNEDYLYKISETKIVPKTELSVLDNTDKPILTMFTCHPIYSTEERIVIIADLIE